MGAQDLVAGIFIRNILLHVCTGTGTVFSAVTSQRSSASNRKPERQIDYLTKKTTSVGIRNVYCAQKQNTFSTVHHKYVVCTETEHFPDGTRKALFTDHKTTIKDGSQRITYAIKTN